MDWNALDSEQAVPIDPRLKADYEAESGGAPPGPAAAWAYSEAVHLLDAIDVAAHAGGHPTRTGVQVALTGIR
jgi:hypothetical protein